MSAYEKRLAVGLLEQRLDQLMGELDALGVPMSRARIDEEAAAARLWLWLSAWVSRSRCVLHFSTQCVGRVAKVVVVVRWWALLSLGLVPWYLRRRLGAQLRRAFAGKLSVVLWVR